jgi:hypothetical protein
VSFPKYRSGFSFLVEGVRAYFLDQSYPTAIHVGVKAYFEQWNQGAGGADRVVFIPGEFHGEQVYRSRPYGSLQPKLGNQTSGFQEVAQWTRPITIACWAPPSLEAPTDELLQNDRTEQLFEAVRVAAQVVQAADIAWGDVERVAPPQERAFGEAILIHAEQRGPLYYPALQRVFPSPAVARGAVT